MKNGPDLKFFKKKLAICSYSWYDISAQKYTHCLSFALCLTKVRIGAYRDGGGGAAASLLDMGAVVKLK